MQSFKLLSQLEGLSLLLLLGVAMPLKYVYGQDGLVFYLGMAHGVLFLCYLLASLAVSHKQRWSVWYWLYVMALGLLPLGFLLLGRQLRGIGYGVARAGASR